MKLRVVALAALTVSTGALADTTFDLGTIFSTSPIGDLVTGTFTDTYQFNVGTASTGAVVAYSTSYDITPPGITLGKINSFSAMLDGIPLTWSFTSTPISPGITQELQLLANLSVPLVAGAHSLVVSGVADVNSAYTGTIKVTAVPEPETYALMLAGLAAVGFLASRRRAV